jgi:endo-1,4-beta-xylanase
MNRKPTLISSVRLLVVLVLIGVALSFGTTRYTAQAQTLPPGSRLRDLAGSFLIGYASRSGFQTMSDAAQWQTVARREFNLLTPENDMKWDTIHPQPNQFNFGPADTHVAFAQANGMTVHGHTLVWHSQNPSWFSNPQSVGMPAWNATTLTNAYNSHIDAVVGRYANSVAIWDVVNEAFQDGSGALRTEFPWNIGGRALMEQAFRRARADDSDAILVYNDFNIETVNTKSNSVFSMAQDFVNRGVPINGIGFQMHLTNGGIDTNSLRQNMQRFANLGLSIYITEMDVRFPTPLSQNDLNTQATIYRNVLDVCLTTPACKALQVWGIPDKYSWVPNTFPGQGGALIFDDNYTAKPAYLSIQARLGQSNNPTNTPTRTATTGPSPTRTNTPTTGPSATPTRTPTPGGAGTCSPVNATITAPFTFDGAGTLCWRSSNLGNNTNNWNLQSLTINGVDFTSKFVFTSQLPPKAADGFWYISYTGNFPWSHFEAR